MMQRWSDLTPEEQARYEDREQLPAGAGKTLPANVLVEMLERKGAVVNGGEA